MKRIVLIAGLIFLGSGCASSSGERQSSPPFWFQKSDFVRPGNASIWNANTPQLSICASILGGIVQGLGHVN